MGKSSKTPKYQGADYATGGLFGDSITTSKGTTYTPNDNITMTGETAWSGLNNSLNNIASNDYSNDANFQAYQDALNKSATQNYEVSVLGNLADRGLMRSSGLQAATNSFNNTLANQTTDLYDSYYNRQANNLSNYQNTLNTLFNYITGVNTGSQNQANNVNNYNISKASTDSAIKQANTNNMIMSGGLSALWGG